MPKASDQPGCSSCTERAPHPIFDLCEAKRFDEALQICRAEISAKPTEATGYRHMASVLELMEKPYEALPYRNKVIERAPENGVDHFARADLHYRLGNYLDAIADFTRSAELDHEQVLGPANYLYRADCYRHLGDYDKATADCALVPDDFDFPGFLGQWEGSKRHLLAVIARERKKARSS